MSIDYKIYNFPALGVSKQLFHVPGAATEGGFTTGGARITSPEPGGFSILEIELSLLTGEDVNPWASWLMSKANGQIFRVPLTKTPQLITSRSLAKPVSDAYPRDDAIWHAPNLTNDLRSTFTANALPGSNVVSIDVSHIGWILRPGHLFGHAYDTYLIDEISYSGNIATIVTTPPLRRAIASGDTCLFRPIFTGSITNGADIRSTYDKANDGAIQLQKLILNEVVI